MNYTWVKYSTENGDTWLRYKQSGLPNPDDDQLVSEGSVTYKKEMHPADDVVVQFIPTSKIIDEITQDVGERGRFYIYVSLLSNDDWFAMSYKAYDKNEAIRIGSQFLGLNKRQAERVWRAKKLGEVKSTKLSW